jgi:hypothetical protein
MDGHDGCRWLGPGRVGRGANSPAKIGGLSFANPFYALK